MASSTSRVGARRAGDADNVATTADSAGGTPRRQLPDRPFHLRPLPHRRRFRRGGHRSTLAETVRELRGRIIAADPARQRVRLGSRASSSLVIALAIMSAVAHAGGQPISVALLGGVIGMVTATSVNDPTSRGRAITLALAPIVAASVVAAAASLSRHPVWADVTFVAIMAVAVWVRRFGPRGLSLGMVAFMTFFFSLFLRVTERQVPWLVVAALVGAATTALVRFVLLPDRPASDLRRLLAAVRSTTAVVARSTADVLDTHAGRLPALKRLRRSVRDLDAVALLVEKQLEEDVRQLVDDPERVCGLVFDVEMAAEHLSSAVEADAAQLRPGTTGELAGAARRLGTVLRTTRAPVARTAVDAVAGEDPGGHWHQPEHHVRSALGRLAGELDELTSVEVHSRRTARGTAHVQSGPAGDIGDPRVTDAADQNVAQVDASPAIAPSTGWRSRLQPTDRTAVQVTLAGALAILAGQAVSMQRWYWAVIGAFVVFTNTQTRGATVRRAGARVLGTAIGVVAGLALGDLLSGDSRVELALIVVLVFTAFWIFQVSYTAMILCFTVMLALLYSLLGTLSGDVLLLRVEETLIGAGIGGAVAVLVLPRTGRGAFDESAATVLDRLDDLLEALENSQQRDSKLVRGQVRKLDQAFQDLRTTTRPLVIGVPGPIPAAHRRQLLLVAGARWWARLLTTVATLPDAMPVPSDELHRVRHRVRDVAAALRDPDAEPREAHPAVEDAEADVIGLTEQPTTVVALARLGATIRALADERGVAPAPIMHTAAAPAAISR